MKTLLFASALALMGCQPQPIPVPPEEMVCRPEGDGPKPAPLTPSEPRAVRDGQDDVLGLPLWWWIVILNQ